MTSWLGEVRVVNEDGRPGEILPDWSSLSYLDPDNEAGQVIMTYPTEGKRSSLIAPGREYALLVDGEEIPNSRFRLDETTGNTITEGSPQITWTGSTLMMRFDEILVVPNVLPHAQEDVLTPEEAAYKAKVDAYEAAMTRYQEALAQWKRNGERGDKPRKPKRTYTVNDKLQEGLDNSPPAVPPDFKKDTPGQVLRYLVQIGQERGAANELTLGFTSDRDSNGVRWTNLVTQQWDVGTSVYEVMRWMVEQKFAEFRMIGRELKAFIPDTGVDRTDPHVLLARGKNLQDGPLQATSKEQATAVFCISDKGPHGWVRDGALIEKYGRIEAKMTAAGINTWAELQELGFRYLEQHGEPRSQYTYGVVPGRGADPYKDYQQGDWVYVLDGESAVRRRVRQIGLSFDENRGAKIALTLHDLITEREIANAQALRSLLGRTAQTSISSTNARSPESLADGVAPVQPSAPVITQRAGVVRITYNGLDVDDQEAKWDQAAVEVHVVESPDTQVSTDTLYDRIVGSGVSTLPDLTYDVEQYVRFVAVDAGGDKSEPSPATPVTPQRISAGEVDPSVVTPPVEIPGAAPTLYVEGNAEGLLLHVDDVPMTDEIEYHLSLTDGFTPDPTTLAVKTRSAVAPVTSMPDGSPLVESTIYYVKARAVNSAGPGPYSAQASGSLDPSKLAQMVLMRVITGLVMTGRIEVGLSSWDADEGLVFRTPAGVPYIVLPADGVSPASFEGHITAKSMTAEDNVNLYGLTQEFGKFRLTAGVTNPKIKASMSRDWPKITAPNVANDSIVPPSLARGLTVRVGEEALKWVVIRSFFGSDLRSFDKADGDNDPFFFPSAFGRDFYPAGITALGSYYYVLGQDNTKGGDWWIYQLDSTGVRTAVGWAFGPTTVKRPTIGNDGTNIIAAWANSTGSFIRVRTFSTAGTNLGDIDCTHNLGVTFDLGGIYRGSADFGADRFVIAPYSRDPLVFNSTGVRQASQEWARAGGTNVMGFVWDAGKFHHLDDQGRVWTYPARPAATTVYSSYAWYDGDVSSGSTVHETAAAPAESFVWPARTRLSVSGSPAPDAGVTDPALRDKVNLVRVYAGATASTMRLQPQSGTGGALPLGQSSASVEVLDTVSALAPTASTFDSTSGGVGLAEAAEGGFYIDGQSNGSVGTGSFAASISDRVADTVQAGSLSTGALSAGADKTLTVVFPTAFATAPVVVSGVKNSTGGGGVFTVVTVSSTTTGCTLIARRETGTAAFEATWIATPTS